MALSIMSHSIMTLSIMSHSIMTLSIMTLSINDTKHYTIMTQKNEKHNDSKHNEP